MDVSVSQDEINRLRSFVVGNPAYDNLSLRRWSPINDDPNYEIKKVVYFDENNNIGRKKIIVKRKTDPNNLSADAYSILFNFQGTGGKKSRKRRNKKSRKRRNKKSRKG